MYIKKTVHFPVFLFLDTKNRKNNIFPIFRFLETKNRKTYIFHVFLFIYFFWACSLFYGGKPLQMQAYFFLCP